VNAEQAQVILRALTDLPADLDPDLATRAEAHLLELALDHDAQALRLLGRHLLQVVAPQTADAHEAALLEREERAAAAATRLVAWEDGHGQVPSGSPRPPRSAAARSRTATGHPG
jgi:hypothetical protein